MIINDIERLALRRELFRQNAKQGDFLSFIYYINTDYKANWHHTIIIKELQNFLSDPPKKNLAIFIPPQHGKLLPIDTPILTINGWVNHGDLKPGDFVYGQDGKPKKVLANSGSYKWNVVNIVFQDGKKIKCAIFKSCSVHQLSARGSLHSKTRCRSCDCLSQKAVNVPVYSASLTPAA